MVGKGKGKEGQVSKLELIAMARQAIVGGVSIAARVIAGPIIIIVDYLQIKLQSNN